MYIDFSHSEIYFFLKHKARIYRRMYVTKEYTCQELAGKSESHSSNTPKSEESWTAIVEQDRVSFNQISRLGEAFLFENFLKKIRLKEGNTASTYRNSVRWNPSWQSGRAREIKKAIPLQEFAEYLAYERTGFPLSWIIRSKRERERGMGWGEKKQEESRGKKEFFSLSDARQRRRKKQEGRCFPRGWIIQYGRA